MIPRDFHFGAFENVWHILWLLPLLGLILYAIWRKKTDVNDLVEPKLQPFVLIRSDPFWLWIKIGAFLLGWVMTVISLMNPLGNEYYQENKVALKPAKNGPSLDLFILMDVSQSMASSDMRGKKTRLQVAEEITDRLISKLKTDSTALYAFTSELVPLVPLTLDRTFLRLLLGEVQFNEENHFGTNFSIILKQLQPRLNELYPKSAKAVLVFSDGEDNSIEALAKGEQAGAINSLAAIATELKVPIFTVGMGTKEGGEVPDVEQGGGKVISRLNETVLKTLSEKTDGRYFSGSDQSPDEIAARINQSLERTRLNAGSDGVYADSSGKFHHYFQFPLALALLLFVFSWLSPSVRNTIYLMLFVGGLNATNPGETLYDAEKYQEAADWFSGELKHLPQEWLKNKLLYNEGTSFLQRKKGEEASRAFFAITDEAYTYPLFRLRLIYNQVLAAMESGQPFDLQNALFLLQLVDLDRCKEDCPEAFLREMKWEIQARLSIMKEKGQPSIDQLLQALIQQFRLAYLLDSSSLDGLEAIFNSVISQFQKTPEADLAKKHLKNAMDSKENRRKELGEGALALSQLRKKLAKNPANFLKASLSEIVLAAPLKANQALARDNKGFYPFIFEWQKKEFAKGKCQCDPWREALPVFTEGLRMLEVPPFEQQFNYTYYKWQEVLAMLESRQSSIQTQEPKPEDESLKELREMQALDKAPENAKMKSIGEGMPW